MCKINAFFERRRTIREIQKNEIECVLTNEKVHDNFKDIDSDNVSYLIEYSEDEFFIFLDSEEDLDWETTTKYDEAVDKKAWSEIQAEVARINNSPSLNNLNKELRKRANILLGMAIANVKSPDIARKIVKDAEVYVLEREKETVRKYFCILALLNITFLVIGSVLNTMISAPDIIVVKYTPVIYGILGGDFSILINSRKNESKYNIGSGRGLIVVEFMSRIAISGIAAFIIFICCEAGIVGASITEGNLNYLMRNILYIACGFSERIVPSLMERIGGRVDRE